MKKKDEVERTRSELGERASRRAEKRRDPVLTEFLRHLGQPSENLLGYRRFRDGDLFSLLRQPSNSFSVVLAEIRILNDGCGSLVLESRTAIVEGVGRGSEDSVGSEGG